MLGILTRTVGVIQATKTIKLILGEGDPLIGRLLLVDALGMKFRELSCAVWSARRAAKSDHHQLITPRSSAAFAERSRKWK